MKILFVSPEMSPFARTGGLGEVVGSLPIALRKIGLDPRVLCPLHQDCKNLPIKMFKRKIIFESEGQKIISEIGTLTDNNFPIPVYFLSNKKLLKEMEFMRGMMVITLIIGYVRASFLMLRLRLKTASNGSLKSSMPMIGWPPRHVHSLTPKKVNWEAI